MLKNIKIRTKLFIGFGLIIVLSGLFGLYIVIQINSLQFIARETKEATKLSQLGLVFSEEFFHTQLEVWEYAYIPDRTRFEAFEQHNTELTKRINALVEEVEEEKEGEFYALIPGGESTIKDVVSNLEEVRNGWEQEVLPAIARIEDAINTGESPNTIATLRSEALPLVDKNESIFDSVKTNEFILGQQEHVSVLGERQTEIGNSILRTVYILVGALLLSGAGVAFWFTSALSKSISQVRNAAIEIARGNMDTEIDTSGKDEIAELSQAIDKMRQSLKVVMQEYERKLK